MMRSNHVAFFITKTIDPSVVIRVEEESLNIVKDCIKQTPINGLFSQKLTHHLKKCERDSSNKKFQKEFFNRVTNYDSQKNQKEDCIKASDFLDIETTNDQKNLLHRNSKGILLGRVACYEKG